MQSLQIMNPNSKRSPMSRSAMTSQTPSKALLINRNGISNSLYDDVPELSESAERRYLYDASTWRMYYRILNGRKRRTQVAAMSDKRPVQCASFGTSTSKEMSFESFLKKHPKSRNEKKRSLSICSDATRESAREEEIFALDL